MSKPTTEEMLEWYDHIINRMSIGTDEYFMFQAIRSLVESSDKGPEVSEKLSEEE